MLSTFGREQPNVDQEAKQRVRESEGERERGWTKANSVDMDHRIISLS